LTTEWKPDTKDESPLDSTKTSEERGFSYLTDTKEVRVSSGDQSYRVNKQGMFLGSEQFDIAPFRVNMAGQLYATSVNTLQQEITVETNGDIQTAINTLTTTGGIVKLKSGTYVLTDDINIPSNVKLVGNGQAVTILYFATLNKGIKAQGSSSFSTGSVSISNGTNVLVGGTAWLTNLTTNHKVRLDNFWYDIGAVVSNQSAVLTTNYIGTSLTNEAYDSAIMAQNFSISDLSVVYSGGNGIYLNYVYYWFMDRVSVAYCGGNGVDINNSTSSHMAWVSTFDNVGNGVDLNQIDHLETQTIWTMRNGGVGVMGTNVRDTNFTSILGRNNTDGAYFDTLEDSVVFATDLSNNSSQGMEMINSNNVFIVSSEFQNNTSDGLKLTSNCDKVIVAGASFKSNSGCGINIANANCDGNILSGNVYTSNGSVMVSDSGTGTKNDLTFLQAPNFSTGGIIISDAGGASTISEAWIKMKEIKVNRAGSISVYFGIANSHNSRLASARIRVNDVGVGTEQSTMVNTYTYYSEDITVANGDFVQIYGKTADAANDHCNISSFRILVNATSDTEVLL